jgi:hypothetical protein
MLKPSDNEKTNNRWADTRYDYFVYTGSSVFDYYCISIGEG